MFDAKETAQQITDWIAAYFAKNAAPETKAVIGISGGKDSSVVAALCVRALGRERVFGVLMPQGEQHDIDVSHALCEELGIEFTVVNIADAVNALYSAVQQAELKLNSIATFNTPARVRMATLYAVSAIVGGRVANTCNLSEDHVGYSTKFGDAAGDFSPLSRLTVTEVRAIGHAIGLPARFVDKTPIDGLCGKTDEENLGFSYATLDRYIKEGVCEDEAVKASIDRLHQNNLHKLLPMPVFEPSGSK